MSEKTYHSVNEIKREFFPQRYEEERLAKMTPRERGRDIAQKIIIMIRDELKGEQK
jgi:hypothetical protein